MAQSLNQLKKQDSKKGSGVGGWRRWGRERLTKFEKAGGGGRGAGEGGVGRQYRGAYIK